MQIFIFIFEQICLISIVVCQYFSCCFIHEKILIKIMMMIPLIPTVKELLSLYTGVPVFVVMKGELYALDGRNCTTIKHLQ